VFKTIIVKFVVWIFFFSINMKASNSIIFVFIMLLKVFENFKRVQFDTKYINHWSFNVATKTRTQREVDATTTIIITSYSNINQQKQLKKVKRKKTLIYKIDKQREKNNLRTLFVKKLIERLQKVEKIKENVLTTRRFFNENVELITRSKKTKNQLTINNSLLKNVVSSTYTTSKISEILIHEMRVIDVQTIN
jgi:hypothetical protein